VVLAVALVGLAAAATWSVWSGIFDYAWRNEEQSHSLIALPLAAWLVWVRRARIKGLSPEWTMAGPLLMGVGWLISITGFQTGVELGLHIGALLLVVGAGLTALGPRILVAVLPAVVALVLVLPVPGRLRMSIAGPLQELSAQAAHFILDLCGVPALRSGNILTINGVDVAIAEACNGMRLVSALAVISYAFVFSIRLRPAARAGILALSPLIALAVNVMRLIPTALVYGYSSKQNAEAFHDISGWGVLVLAIGVMLGIVSLLRWLEVPIDEAPGRKRPSRQGEPQLAPSLGWAAPAAAIGVLAIVVVFGGFDARRVPGVESYHARIRAAVDAVPYRIGTAIGTDAVVSPGTIRILRPNAILERRYEIQGLPTRDGFGLIVVHCSDVRDLDGHYPPKCYPAHGWIPSAEPLGRELIAGSTRARLYEYKRSTDLGEAKVRVVSCFVLPGPNGGVADTMEALLPATRSTRAAGLGAAHFIISFAGSVDDQTLTRTLESVFEQLQPIIRTVEAGVSGE
jgi:exosortase